jgi:membrane protease YdiL (CAAX protease family)
MGDVMYGLLLWLVGGVLGTVYLFASGGVDVENAAVGELSVSTLAVVLGLGWIGFVGWPLVATYRKGQRSLRKDFGVDIRWIDVGWGLLGGAGAIAVSIAGSVLWTVISGDPSPQNAEFLPSSPGVFDAVVIWFLVAVCTPFAEELFFRGLMLRAVGRRWGLVTGVIASSIVFGMFHITTFDIAGLFIIGVTACYGAVFALLVIRAEGRLGPAFVAHSLVNTLGVLVLVFT